MKYALCFRGISYYKDYIHNDSNEAFDVDFSQTLNSFKQNIINPLKENGHEVDVFFTTYETEKLNYFIEQMNPVKVKLNTYQTLSAGTWSNVFKIIIDSLTLVKEYQEETNSKYDFIIVSRFDNYIFENITNLFIPNNAISSISKGEDNFFIISGYIFELVYNYFIDMKYKNYITHYYIDYCKEHNIRCHKFYNNIDNPKNYPFLKTARQLFTQKNHTFHLCELDDLFNKDSLYYGFKYSPVKEFTPC